MKLDFRSMVLENYGPFVGRHKFSYKDLGPGLYLVLGSNKVVKRLYGNGVGKTYFLNAPSWCLYGTTARGLKTTKIRARRGDGGPTRVKLVLFIDDKRHVIVRRTNPNRLMLDGQDIGQEQLDALLRITFPVFRQTVLFGQDMPLFPDLSNRDKLALLSDVLELDRWELRSMKAAERTRLLEGRMSIIDGDIASAQASIDEVKTMIRKTKLAKGEWAGKHRSQLNELRLLIGEGETKQKHFNREHRHLEDLAIIAAKALGNAQADVEITTTRVQQHDKSQEKLRIRRGVLEADIERTKRSIANLDKVRRCEACGQVIKKSNVAEHKKGLKHDLDLLMGLLNDIKFDGKGSEKLRSEHAVARAKVSKLQPDYDMAKRAAEQMHRLKSQNEAQLNSNRILLKQRRDEANPHDKQLHQLRERRSRLKAALAEYVSNHEKELQRYERTKYWVKNFKDVRLMIIEEVLVELEMATNALIESMGLTGWHVKYYVERETKSGTVLPGMGMSITTPEDKNPVDWDTWSGGESQRLRIASALALSEVLLNHAGVEINLEILDEPTRYFSGKGPNDLIEALAERAEQLGRRILYVDHTVVSGAQFAGVIGITKTKEGASFNADRQIDR